MTKIRMKVRFDYLGKTRQGKFFGGNNLRLSDHPHHIEPCK